MHRTRILMILAVLIAAALLLAACASPTQAPTDAPAPVPTCPAAPEAPPCPTPEPPVVSAVPFEELWAASPHNAADTEAFRHWDEEEAKEIPANCATCHSTTGYLDFLGADGSEAGKVDAAAPIGTTVECQACHNPAAAALTSVTFPSTVTVNDLGPEARCMICHQGRASKKTIDDNIARFNITDLDAVVEPIKDGENTVRFGFVNVHYFAAAATLYAGEVQGGYQYAGKSYDAKNDHVEGYDTCVGCHNPHSTEVKVESCALCHEGVTSAEDLKAIRMISSAPDYDGDGDAAEGMAEEIATLQETLYASILAYAKEVAGAGIVYDVAAHPYFFLDADGDGAPDKNDEGANVAYNTWTARLLMAAYNYQVSLKDPGAYAHGNKYIVQLLYDSIEDLNAKLPSPVDMTAMHRDDAGHFAGNTEAFRHWDAEEFTVPGSCAKCHTSSGMAQFIHEGAVISNKATNGFLCSTCHNEEAWPELYAVTAVPFPSGASVTFSTEQDADGKLIPVAANLCLECHQGRESTVSMNRALTSFKDLDTADPAIRFRNVHYFAAGATLFGDGTKGIYQYDGKTYAGQFMHQGGNLNQCTDCHDAHMLEVKAETCAGCHSVEDPREIRLTSLQDYDGDGDATEGLYGELLTYQEKLLAAIQAYAATKSTGILYDSHAYPYYFVDADGDGAADKNDSGASIGYNAWTPRLVKAAYNYQYAQKDPGAYAHNFKYVIQALYDSIQDLGGDLTGMTRPE